MTLDPEAVERAATALFIREYGQKAIFANASEETRQRLREDARESITAYLGEHSVVVPRRITEPMIIAAIEAHERGKRGYTDQWEAMIAASGGK
jgi:hypothetical protein